MTTAHGLAERVPTWRARSQHGRVGLRRSQGSQNAELAVFRNRQDAHVALSFCPTPTRRASSSLALGDRSTSCQPRRRPVSIVAEPETPTMTLRCVATTTPSRLHRHRRRGPPRVGRSSSARHHPCSVRRLAQRSMAPINETSEPAIEIDAARRDSQHNASAITRGSTWAHHSISAQAECPGIAAPSRHPGGGRVPRHAHYLSSTRRRTVWAGAGVLRSSLRNGAIN